MTNIYCLYHENTLAIDRTTQNLNWYFSNNMMLICHSFGCVGVIDHRSWLAVLPFAYNYVINAPLAFKPITTFAGVVSQFDYNFEKWWQKSKVKKTPAYLLADAEWDKQVKASRGSLSRLLFYFEPSTLNPMCSLAILLHNSNHKLLLFPL